MDIHETSSNDPPMPSLVPFSVPSGWVLQYHELREIDPKNLAPKDPNWELIGEDLLQLTQADTGLRLDVGWYPGESPDGQFQLVIINDYDWDNPLFRFQTRSLKEIKSRIQLLLANPPHSAVPPGPHEPSVSDLATILEHDPDPHESVWAAQVLALRERVHAVPVLIARLSDPRSRVRYAVVDALRRIGDPAAGSALYQLFLLPEPDLDTRRILLRALGAVGYAPAIPMLVDWLKNPDAQQRAAAASALAKLKASGSLSEVTEAYAIERNRPAREEMRSALNVLAHACRDED